MNAARARADSTTMTLPGPAGDLEALLEVPRDLAPTGSAVVCHPHPLHGGTMQNKVAHTLARAFVASGFAALRFNFRGAGQSSGAFDEGRGEVEDVVAAVRWIRREYTELPLWLGGFSFGAAMAMHAAVRCNADGLVSVAPAVSRLADDVEEQPGCPWLIVQGDRDELVDVDETIGWVNSLEPGPALEVFAGTEHFFHGRLVRLRETVERFVADASGRGSPDIAPAGV